MRGEGIDGTNRPFPAGRNRQAGFPKRLEQMKEKVMKDQDVQAFLKENEEVIDQK